MKDIPALTGLRFFAAFFVLIAHGLLMVMPFKGTAPSWYALTYSLSGEGMTLFFVLSGFVIHYNYSVSIREDKLIGVYNFFIARFSRLYPLFFAGLLFDLIHLWGYTLLPASFERILPYYLTLTQSWFYLLFNKHILIYQFGPIPQVAWSISTEWFFYLCYPIVCWGLLKIHQVRSKIITLLGLIVAIFLGIFLFTIKTSLVNDLAIHIFGPVADINNGFNDCFIRWALYFSPYARINEFFVGCLTAAIYMQLQHISVTQRENIIAIFMILFSLTGITLLHYFAFGQGAHLQYFYFRLHNFASNLVLGFGFAPFFAILLFCVSRYENMFSRFFSHRAFLVGGTASYSIYIFHIVILSVFAQEAAPVTSLKVAIADLSRLFFAVTIIIGAGIFSYRIFEVPVRRYLRRTLTSRSKPNEDEINNKAINI